MSVLAGIAQPKAAWLAGPDAAAGAATVRRLRLWHTAVVLATLAVATPSQPGFSFANLLILAVAVAVLYPVQKKIREVASRRRRERWARQDRDAEELLQRRDRDGSAGPGSDAS
jgi:hypothetical protein